nr:hypothetical protein [Burkholderia sp. AU30198]
MALAAARHFLTRVVHDQYDVAGSAGSERLHKASCVAHRLGEIETAVTEVLLLNESGFTSKLDSYGRIVELIENGVGRFFNDENFQMGKVIGGDRGEILDRYRVRPKVQLFFDVCARHPVGQYGAQYFAAHPASRTPDGKQFLWESYNELIEMMRAEAEARRLDKLDIANTFRSTRAFNSMMAVVKRCFAKRSRIFVVCMDVFYHADWADKVAFAARHESFETTLMILALPATDAVGFAQIEYRACALVGQFVAPHVLQHRHLEVSAVRLVLLAQPCFTMRPESAHPTSQR